MPKSDEFVPTGADSPMSALEQSTMRRVTNRIIPFLMLCYFVAYLDRVNVGFAALQMNKALGLNGAAYGFGAGLFFVGYFLCEVPSNLLLFKFGARRWIARIMFTWGICAGAMAFVGGETSFYVVRTLLGVAEAGFQPGVLFFSDPLVSRGLSRSRHWLVLCGHTVQRHYWFTCVWLVAWA